MRIVKASLFRNWFNWHDTEPCTLIIEIKGTKEELEAKRKAIINSE